MPLVNNMKYFFLFFLLSHCCTAATLSLVPSAGQVNSGSTFSLAVMISNVTDLYAYELGMTFNSALVAGELIGEREFLPSGGATNFVPGAFDNLSGVLSASAGLLTGLNPGVSGSGVLMELTFSAHSPGTAVFDLADIILLDSNLNDIPFTVESGSVTIIDPSPVPEPLGLHMLLAGALILVVASSRLRTASKQ